MNEKSTVFEKDLSALGISLNDQQRKQFRDYYELLIEWNRFMNLTAITDYEEVMKKHFIDSLTLVKYDFDYHKKISMIDIGTGAGFPGIPIKIVFPNIEVTLLDSLHKRVEFLKVVVSRLALDQVTVLHGRAEDYARNEKMRERYDLCISRAVANLTILLEYCLPYVKIGGHFISYKTEKSEDELNNAQRATGLLGGLVVQSLSFDLPDSNISRILYIIEKVSCTPDKYPRKAGIPIRKPI